MPTKTFIVTTGGYIPAESDKYTENVAEVEKEILIEELPQMLNSMRGGLVRQIEDPEHPLNGWEIEKIHICLNEEIEEDTEEDTVEQREDWREQT